MPPNSVLLRIARKKTAFNVENELLMLASIDVVRHKCGKELAAKLATVPLLNDTGPELDYKHITRHEEATSQKN